MAISSLLFGCAGASEGDAATGSSDKAYIEETLDLSNNDEQQWTYSAQADAWTLSAVAAVAYPELPDQQGVSVCVPGAYVTGVDTDGDGVADVSCESPEAEAGVLGGLVIDYDAEVTSTNGQVYTAATAPVVLNTGAAGYGSQSNSLASSAHAADGYVNVSCGNRGKQDTVTTEDGSEYYTGDAPSCLADQKAAARYVKYNILLGNLPGSVDYFVSTGGSGGGAHAAMFAATGNNPDYYDYQIEAGAVGVYRTEDGGYSTSVTIDGSEVEISDGAWGCIAYSAITSLAEADMALAFEYSLDADYSFASDFQAALAEHLSAEYMEYINSKNLQVEEGSVGFDLNEDGDLDDRIALRIERDLQAHPETNGYYGSYLDLYLAEFEQNLQWYVDNLSYAEGWTWFDEGGDALSDQAVATMTAAEKAQAFVEGRYAKGASDGGAMGGSGRPGAEMGEPGSLPDGTSGGDPLGDAGSAEGDLPSGDLPSDDLPSGDLPEATLPSNGAAGGMAGTPESGTTQSNAGGRDSSNYASYEEMLEAYQNDIAEVEEGDKYGNNIVELYDPLNYIGVEGTDGPAWSKIIMGAAEGDISLMNSLNLQLAWLNAGTDAVIEWQWGGGHVPSEILGDSFSLYLDQMYGEYVAGAQSIEKPGADAQSENGTAEEATGSDISSWVSCDEDGNIRFGLSDAAAYRTAGASKAMPGFDTIDYGQEDYVFGSSEKDARHWDSHVLEVLEEHADELSALFNS